MITLILDTHSTIAKRAIQKIRLDQAVPFPLHILTINSIRVVSIGFQMVYTNRAVFDYKSKHQTLSKL